LDATQWSALSRLLEEALDQDEPAREAWLARQEGLEPKLRAAVIELIASGDHERTHSVIDALPTFDVGEDTAEVKLAEGARVGAYVLLRRLGRGGMGEVWLAQRADGPARRRVALKLPRTSRPDGVLAERFARECSILARLAHPNIARLYEAGVAGAQAYLALEYVEGVPLTQYCDERKLGLDARITLFLQVLAAVEYAHRGLVLHRDLKPSNMMVTAQGIVKLLDFGIAKLLAGGRAEETDITRMGGHALTVAYAAPEQVTGAPLTTAADVYALGVVLYELLTGARPLEVAKGGLAEIEDAIGNADPRPPSEAASDARLRRALAGDLDTIVLKALRKAPEDRYRTAGALADDLSRHRARVPLQAQPASRWRRALRLVGLGR
jgi:serine/threonine-protein kinase